MKFANPIFLLLLLLVPAYITAAFLARRKKPAIRVPVLEDLKRAQRPSIKTALPWIRHGLIILALALFAVALARPQQAHERQDVSKNGIDLIVALDVSESMLTQDLQPNRLGAAKESVQRLVNSLKDDRLGIVVFAGQAFTQSPLTFDYGILGEYLSRISTQSIKQHAPGLGGTAVGDAILAAVNRFRDSKDRTRVLVLITDGDANTGVDPKIAAQKAADEGIKIYTIGVGSQGAAYPARDNMGNMQVARNPDGSILAAGFNEDALKDIAKTGHGRYFRAGDVASFHTAMDEINKLEKRNVDVSTATDYTDQFMPWVVALFVTMITLAALTRFEPAR